MDKIFNTDPDDVPVSTAIGRSTATNTYHEWQRDTLAAPNKDNALIDGADFFADNINPTSRIGNHCQIFGKQPAVSRRANIVKKAGLDTAMSYEKAKMLREIKRDIEAMLLSSNVALAGNSSTASKSAGFGAMIYSNVDSGVGGSTPAHTSGAATVAPTPGTARAFTETLLKNVVQLAYTNSGEIPEMVVMSPNHKNLFSAFAGIAVNRYQVKDNDQGHIIGGADVYMSNFGQLTIYPHYILNGSSTVFLLNPDYASVAYLDPVRFKEMGPSGDSEKVLITMDLCLRVNSEKAMAKIADLTP